MGGIIWGAAWAIVGIVVALVALAWIVSELYIRIKHRRRMKVVPTGEGAIPTPSRRTLMRARAMFRETEPRTSESEKEENGDSNPG